MAGSVGQVPLSRTAVLVLLVVTSSGVRARVLNDIHDIHECGNNFYQNMPPTFPRHLTLNFRAISQTYRDMYYFATMFDTEHKIPVYSAYRWKGMQQIGETIKRLDKWMNEPQLERIDGDQNMILIPENERINYKQQSTDLTYENNNPPGNAQGQKKCHRGHLNPVCHHNNQLAANATFTHTNAVPQYGPFNIRWYHRVEKKIKENLLQCCDILGAQKYIVTGAVPSRGADEQTIGPENNNVNVPSHMWSAVCCDTSSAENAGEKLHGWSWGYLGKNDNTGGVETMSVNQLNQVLTGKYGGNIKIFADIFVSQQAVHNCNFRKDIQQRARRAVRAQVQNQRDNLRRPNDHGSGVRDNIRPEADEMCPESIIYHM